MLPFSLLLSMGTTSGTTATRVSTQPSPLRPAAPLRRAVASDPYPGLQEMPPCLIVASNPCRLLQADPWRMDCLATAASGSPYRLLCSPLRFVQVDTQSRAPPRLMAASASWALLFVVADSLRARQRPQLLPGAGSWRVFPASGRRPR